MGSNYDKMLEMARQQFADLDGAALARKKGIRSDGEYLYLTMMGAPFRIALADGRVETSSARYAAKGRKGGEKAAQDAISGEKDAQSFRPAEPYAAMTIYDILCYADGPVKPGGTVMQLSSLVTLLSHTGDPARGMAEKEALMLDGKEEALRCGLRELGGVPEEKGDVSASLPFYEDFRVIFRFWAKDEDFPPQIQILWDTEILHLMHYETVCYASGIVIGKIMDACAEAQEQIKE